MSSSSEVSGMDAVLKPVATLLMTDDCYDTFFHDFDFLNGDCLAALISKGLGLAIVAGAVMVKVPQIQKVWAAKSAEGLSFFGLLLELYAYSSMIGYCYNKEFPFSSYGDSFFVMIQTVILGFLMKKFTSSVAQGLAFVLIYFSILFVLISGMTPISVLTSMQTSNLPVVVVSKGIQAWANFSSGHTGQLSAITIFLIFFGSIARIFTSIQETGDPIMVWTYIIASMANFVLAFQIVYYWKATENLKKKKE